MLNTNRAEDLLSIATAVLVRALRAWPGITGVQLLSGRKPLPFKTVSYLLLGRPNEAEKTFRRDLEINPDNPRSLFGLGEALKAQAKSDAAAIRQRFEQSWKEAEIQLSVDEM